MGHARMKTNQNDHRPDANASSTPPAQTPPPPPQPKQVVVGPHREYTVKSGDTLSLIAEAFGTTVSKIKEMNRLKNDNLRIGQKLMLPQ